MYFKLFPQTSPTPAVGIATKYCAVLNSSFVNPTLSFPNKNETFSPSRANFAALRHASLESNIGCDPSRFLAVVANTTVRSAVADFTSGYHASFDALSSIQSAAQANRYASPLIVFLASLLDDKLAVNKSGISPSVSLASSLFSYCVVVLRFFLSLFLSLISSLSSSSDESSSGVGSNTNELPCTIFRS